MLVNRLFALRVISCDDPNKWYADKVDAVLEELYDVFD